MLELAETIFSVIVINPLPMFTDYFVTLNFFNLFADIFLIFV